jgi:outer membrane protein TolC
MVPSNLSAAAGRRRRLGWPAGVLLLVLLGPLGRCAADPPRRITISFEPIPDATEPPQSSAVPPPVAEFPIDLETALGLAGVDNPTIALAREAVRASRAEQLQARALLLPTLHAGANIDVHRGTLQSAQGVIEDVNRQALYVGAGASAVGAGTVAVPGVSLNAQLAEAVFEPAAARQRLAAAGFDALAVRNGVLLDVTTRYFALVGAEAQVEALRQSEADLGEIVRLTVNFARVGQGRESDAERARSEALLLHAREQAAEGEAAAAAADLARLLNTDPGVRLRPRDRLIPLVSLVDANVSLEALVRIALANRPEMAARAATVAATETRLREEQVRPFVPRLFVGYSAGEFGGGSNQADTRFGHFDGRADFDVLAVWSLDGFGLGNLAEQRRRRAEVGEAEAGRVRAIDRIRREVAEAQALAAGRLREMEIARRRLETAQEAYRLDLTRIRNLVGTPQLKIRAHPIEVLDSANLLTAARLDLVRATIGYDQAEFQLFVALGRPPTLALPGHTPCP